MLTLDMNKVVDFDGYDLSMMDCPICELSYFSVCVNRVLKTVSVSCKNDTFWVHVNKDSITFKYEIWNHYDIPKQVTKVANLYTNKIISTDNFKQAINMLNMWQSEKDKADNTE